MHQKWIVCRFFVYPSLNLKEEIIRLFNSILVWKASLLNTLDQFLNFEIQIVTFIHYPYLRMYVFIHGLKGKQGQGNQCRTPGFKFESQSKSLNIIKNQEKQKKGEPRKNWKNWNFRKKQATMGRNGKKQDKNGNKRE